MRDWFNAPGVIRAALLLIVAAALAGCSGTAPPPEAPKLLELSEADRTTALAQRVCPVDGELLGMKGTPAKVQVKNQEVFVCNAACEEALRKEPQRYLQILEAAKTE